MRNAILIGLFLLLLAGAASADRLEILYRDADGDTFRVAYASVTVRDSGGKIVFEGSTDKYGRIELDIRNGRYDATVVYRQKDWSLSLSIDGSNAVKTRYL